MLAILAIMMTVKQYVIIVALVLLVTFLLRKFIDRKSFISLGFNWKGYSNEACLGFFSAIAILGIGTIILSFLGYLSFTEITIQKDILVEVLFLVAVALIEEIMFRGYLLNNLMQSMNKWIALLITAILFTLAHTDNPGVTILPVLNVFVAGVLLGINYIYTKNLWFSIFFHFIWNVFQGPVLGYDVSGIELQSLLQQNMEGPALLTGGAFGFEGSIICLILILLFTAWFGYAFSKRYKFS
jgi:membrane protease YdiL (CAAX protease family)